MEKANKDKTTNPLSAGCLLQPPTPIFRGHNWPTLEVQKTTLEDLSAAQGGEVEEEYEDAVEAPMAPVGGEWDMEDGFDEGPAAAPANLVPNAADDLDFGDEDGAWGDELDDLGDLGDASARGGGDDMAMDDLQNMDDGAGFQMPKAGRPVTAIWCNSSHAADHSAAGQASSSLQLLNRQIAASDFSVLQGGLMGCYLGAQMSVPGVPGSGSMTMPLARNDADGNPGDKSLPRIFLQKSALVSGIRNGYKLFQGGKFNDAKGSFHGVLTQVPLVVSGKNESNEIKEMMTIAKEYITAIRIKGAMSEHANDPVRSTELAAYFTHCSLQPVHLLLALRSAMGTAFKNKNFIVAASFARRLLELPDMSSERNADLRQKATKVLQKSEQMARNEHTLNYDESKTFVIDCQTFVPIYAGEPSLQCSYCGSSYKDQSMKNKICVTCQFCAIGIKTIGLVTA